MYVDKAKTYIGVVEKNVDPDRLGRCKIRVLDIFDDIPTDDIPWASPWKDLNGNAFNLPDVGKVVTVIFDIYKPEYIFAEHFNINLEEKLKSLSERAYTSMKAIMFDDKTQIFSNDDDGLMIDYRYNNINITSSKINVNLKDNFGKINLGDAKAEESAILGTTFLITATPFFGNLGAPVFASPKLIESCKKYFLLREAHFLSNNVYLNKNYKISHVLNTIGRRSTTNVQGDSYQSTAPFSTSNQTQTSAPTPPVDIRPKEPSRLDTSTGAQDLPNYGKLVVSSDKNSPTLICFGGIDVGGRSSGDYMWDYFGDLKNKYQIFVAKDHKVDGEESYKSTIKYLESNGYNTSEQILYLFSGGYRPGMPVLTTYKDKFKKVILVDIWMGNDNVSNYYVTFAKSNKDKTYYIYTSFGANNKQGSQDLAQNSGFSKLNSDGHMQCNKDALSLLLPNTSNSLTAGSQVNIPNSLTESPLNGTQGPFEGNSLHENPSYSRPLGSNGKLDPSSLRKSSLGVVLELEAADAMDKLVAQARADGVPDIGASDGYRSYEVQYAIFDWDRYVRTGGSMTDTKARPKAERKKKGTDVAVAFPGTSNHGWGRAIDASGEKFKKWLKINGYKFGWTWYEGRSVNENWHFTYIPQSERVAKANQLQSFVNYTTWA
jgi:hypothetical protein